MPKKYVPNANLTPTTFSLFAANGTKVPILGSIRLAFTVYGMPRVADLLVLDAVEEVILGITWLRENGCQMVIRSRCSVIEW